MARDETSILRVKIAEWLRDAACKLRDDPEWAARLEDGIVRVASYVAENHVDKVTGVIGETVERWDAEEASDRIELMVGKPPAVYSCERNCRGCFGRTRDLHTD